MARRHVSTPRAKPATRYPDLCPECEADADTEQRPNGFQVVCTNCGIAGPVEPTRRGAERHWIALAAKVRAFDRVREVVAGARA